MRKKRSPPLTEEEREKANAAFDKRMQLAAEYAHQAMEHLLNNRLGGEIPLDDYFKFSNPGNGSFSPDYCRQMAKHNSHWFSDWQISAIAVECFRRSLD